MPSKNVVGIPQLPAEPAAAPAAVSKREAPDTAASDRLVETGRASDILARVLGLTRINLPEPDAFGRNVAACCCALAAGEYSAAGGLMIAWLLQCA